MDPLAEPLEPLLKTAEVAGLYQLNAAHLANLRSKGRGPTFVRLGTAVRYRRSDVEAWIASNLVETSGL